MHLTETTFLPRDEQSLPLARNLGDALATIAKTLWPHHTAKRVEAEWGLDRNTAKNAIKGVVGSVPVTKAVRSRTRPEHDDAWDLWDALGRQIIGESRDEYEERKLRRILENHSHAIETLQARRRRRQELRTFAPSDDSRLAG